jgi:hypothetical protein
MQTNFEVLMKKLTIFPILFIVFTYCAKEPTGPGPNDVITDSGQTFIVDNTGKQWDVTYAQEKYNMNASLFQYGLGPHAIKPINNPSFLSPGQAGYPKNTDTFMVLGVSINGDSRAYPMSVMGRHEVVNDKFGNLYIAVTN